MYGYEIHIVITDNGDKKPYFDLHPSIRIHNLDINYDEALPLYKRFFCYAYKRAIHKKRLDRCLNQLKPDITILMLRRELSFINNITDGSLKIAENHFEKHSYLNNANYGLLRYIPRSIWERWQKLQIQYLKKMKRFVVLTYEDETQWSELDNIEVIPNPLTFISDSTSSYSNNQVIAVGRFVHQKGFDLLISAWKIVARKHADWSLKIYGDGPLRGILQQQIADEGLLDSCKLELPSNNISDKYAESSIFVLSSRYEGFGLVIVEAMSCGLPVVSFDCPCGPKDIITNYEDGILVKTGEIDSLAQQLLYLIEHDEERERMGKKALVNVQRYKIENIAVLWKNLFNVLMQEANNR